VFYSFPKADVLSGFSLTRESFASRVLNTQPVSTGIRSEAPLAAPPVVETKLLGRVPS